MANGEPSGTNTCAMNGLNQYIGPFTVALAMSVPQNATITLITPAAGKRLLIHSILWTNSNQPAGITFILPGVPGADGIGTFISNLPKNEPAICDVLGGVNQSLVAKNITITDGNVDIYYKEV